SYIETDHDQIRAVLNERSLAQGAVAQTQKVDYSGSPQKAAHSRPALPRPTQRGSSPSTQVPTAEVTSTGSDQEIQAYNSPPFCTQRRADAVPPPADNSEQE
ncbi:recombinase XerC, partial [Pseudomonas aeruginosa]|nr:recombinase XerC [Pseudomonas aeruginosa]